MTEFTETRTAHQGWGSAQMQFMLDGTFATPRVGDWAGYELSRAKPYADAGVAVKVLLCREAVVQDSGPRWGQLVRPDEDLQFSAVAEFVPGSGWTLREPTDEDTWISWGYGTPSVGIYSDGRRTDGTRVGEPTAHHQKIMAQHAAQVGA